MISTYFLKDQIVIHKKTGKKGYIIQNNLLNIPSIPAVLVKFDDGTETSFIQAHIFELQDYDEWCNDIKN